MERALLKDDQQDAILELTVPCEDLNPNESLDDVIDSVAGILTPTEPAAQTVTIVLPKRFQKIKKPSSVPVPLMSIRFPEPKIPMYISTPRKTDLYRITDVHGRKMVVCFRCQSVGHVKRFCPEAVTRRPRPY